MSFEFAKKTKSWYQPREEYTVEIKSSFDSEINRYRLHDYFMRLSPRYIKYLIKNWKAFKNTYGSLIALKIMLKPKGLISLRPPGIERTVEIRANSSDIPTFRQMFIKKHYDVDLGFVPTTIIDAGANAGYSAIFFANKYPTAKIIAIEPHDLNFQLLLRNTSNWPQISVIKAALWPENKSLCLTNPYSDYWDFQIEDAISGDIKGITLQYLINLFNIKEISMLKMNIEGSEVQIFRGDLSWLNYTKSLYIEVHETLYPGSSALIMDKLKQAGYVTRSRGNALLGSR